MVTLVTLTMNRALWFFQSPRRGLAVLTHGNQKDPCLSKFFMIQAGNIIDHTFGVRFGFLTLVAAALGNLSLDASGVLFGSVVKSAAARLYLKLPNMTAAQVVMAVTRRTATLGLG
jgi:hypothetical protein